MHNFPPVSGASLLRPRRLDKCGSLQALTRLARVPAFDPAPVTRKRCEPLAKTGGFCLRRATTGPLLEAEGTGRRRLPFARYQNSRTPSCTGTKYDQAVDGYGVCGCLLFAFVVRKRATRKHNREAGIQRRFL